MLAKAPPESCKLEVVSIHKMRAKIKRLHYNKLPIQVDYMKILLSWLKEYLPNIDPQTLPDILTKAGLEVDHIYQVNPLFKNVIAAKVVKVVPHSSSPTLSCVTLFDGKTEQKVVSSAKLYEGQVTAFAPVGAEVGGKEIHPSQFGGEESFGKLCSEHELGLSEFHETDVRC